MARNAGILVAGDIIAKVASLVFYVALARALGQSGFGDFSFALSLAVVLITISGFGLDTMITREVARDRSEIDRMLWNSILAKLTMGGLATAMAVSIAIIGGYSAEVTATVAVLCTANLTELAGKTIGAVFQGVEFMKPVAISSIVQRFSTTILSIIALLLGATVLEVAILYLIGAVAGAIYLARVLQASPHSPPVNLSRSTARMLVIASVPIGVGGIFNTILYRLDSTILSFLKDNDAVGIYGAAYRLLDSTLFISFFFIGAMFPVMSRLTRTTTPTSAQAFELASKALVAVLLPLGTIFVLFAEPIVDLLYGQEFDEAATAVQLLGGACVLYGLGYLSTSMLVAVDRQRALPWLVGGAALANMILNFILIPTHSFNGAAVATTASQAILAVTAMIVVLRSTGRVSVSRIALGPVLAAGAMTGVGLGLGANLPALAAAVIAYVIALVAAERVLYPKDLKQVISVITRRGLPA